MKTQKQLIVGSAVLAVALMTTSASAATTKRKQATQANASAPASSGSSTAVAPAPSRMSLVYAGLLHGPKISNPFGSYQSDDKGNEFDAQGNPTAGPLLIENGLTLGYKTDDSTKVYITPRWNIIPVREQDQNIIMKDPRIGISTKLMQAGVFDMTGHLRLAFGASEKSQASNMSMAPSARLIPNVTLGRWSFSTDTIFTYFIYTNRGLGKQDLDFDIASSPSLGYQLSEKVAFDLTYSMETAHIRGDSYTSYNNQATDLGLGVSWTPIPALTLHPILDSYPGGAFTPSNFVYALEVVATLL